MKKSLSPDKQLIVDSSAIPKEEEIEIPKESKVGKKLSDLTTRRVIMLVLAMMFAVPIFTVSTYKN